MSRLSTLFLVCIVLLYLAIGALFAVKTPLWQVPDEPAHYNYIRQVAQNGCCPVIESGDWDNDYLERIKAAKFDPTSLGNRLDSIQYEDHQPPLYYLIAAPIYTLSSGSLIVLRQLSVLFGAGILVLAWAIVRQVFPDHPYLAVGTAAFIAFLPQHVAMMAGAENDGLAELIVAANVLACVIYLGNGRIRLHPFALGLLLGLSFAVKLTAMLPMLGVMGITLLIKAWRNRWRVPRLIVEGLWIALPALAFGLPIWIRNLVVYGGTDFLAQAAHDRVVVGQLRTQDYIAQVGLSNWIVTGLQTTFQSFWGQFGWMSVPMPNTFYVGLLAFTAFVIVGAVLAFVRWRKALTVPQQDALIILALTAFFAVVQTVGYNLKFIQFQGRYLYAGLIPMGLLVTIGLTGWVALILPRVRSVRWAVPGTLCLFAALDIYVLYRMIIPAL